ncbi:MAG TPA: AraC family transcriptional regulator [Chitinophagaceae bacterium]|jgi:AraC-like DNA-binding protein|nr:AraC family transcriptional regulator [Chitinophagaceae bacterium]
MTNFYDYVRSHPEQLRQFCCKQILFLNLDCPPEFVKGENWNNHNVFVHVLTGGKRMSSREKSWVLDKGSTVFVKKGGVTVERLSHEPFCVLMFFVPDDYLKSFIREHTELNFQVNQQPLTNDRLLPVHSTPVMTAFYQSILSYFSTETRPPENLLELKFKELLLNIITNEQNRELTQYFYKLAQNTHDDLQIIMESNCLYNMQLHEYARLCHRSLSSYKRDFYNTFGLPPGRWLLEKRLSHAAYLLLHSDRSITDIVCDSGFKNITHFNRAFKNQFGLSPLQYRKQKSSTLVYT